MGLKNKNVSKIITDEVGLDRYVAMNYATACEDCSHFDAATETCTFNYPTSPHLKRNQLAQLKANGRMAFCRTMEID
jgi:hypothetical protein